MRLLVAGGAGFIGSTFVARRLAASADSIVVLDKLTYAGSRENLAEIEADANLGPRLRFVQGDICDADIVGSLLAEADAVVNFAAETHVDRSIAAADDFLRTGVTGVHVLLEAVRRAAEARPDAAPRLVQVSTDEVYGTIESGAADEDAPLRPRSPYAAAKAAGDLLCLAYHVTHGTDVVISRGANTYGPRQHPEKLVPLFITNALEGEPLPLYGDGRQRRDWLFVDDHADAIALLLDRAAPGGVYNVTGGDERINRDVADVILAATGRSADLLRSVADRPGHDRRYAMTGDRLAALGWQSRVTFADGMAHTVAWYSANRAWWQRARGPGWADYYERLYGRRLAESTPA
ncbi:MAG: dTDP-glucose 4,6-dehydratase [Chloroflexota bacterium]|jgi:dTDP-glucose 4,6-dehydratase|nr:dTDP-glucose 4,6-dehydratase [Chloroflexota bacterium]